MIGHNGGITSRLGAHQPWPAAWEGGEQARPPGTHRGRGFHRSTLSALAWLAILAHRLWSWLGGTS
jgi:hypothetical protein